MTRIRAARRLPDPRSSKEQPVSTTHSPVDAERLPAILSPGEVADVFGVDPKTVARWAKLGHLPSFRTPGGHRRFRRDDVLAAIGHD